MPNLNDVRLMGNLTRDPEVRYTPGGKAVLDISLAINRNWTTDNGEKREETTFVDITLWGRVAEVVGQYCVKGSPLYVAGRLTLDQWDDRETGQKRSKLKVIGDNIQLLGSKPEGQRAPRENRVERDIQSTAKRQGDYDPDAAFDRYQGKGSPPPTAEEQDDIPF